MKVEHIFKLVLKNKKLKKNKVEEKSKFQKLFEIKNKKMETLVSDQTLYKELKKINEECETIKVIDTLVVQEKKEQKKNEILERMATRFKCMTCGYIVQIL